MSLSTVRRTDLSSVPEPAGAGGLHRGDLLSALLAVFGALVHQNVLRGWRLAGGVAVRCVLPVAVLGGYAYAISDAAPQPRCPVGRPSGAAGYCLLTLPLSISAAGAIRRIRAMRSAVGSVAVSIGASSRAATIRCCRLVRPHRSPTGPIPISSSVLEYRQLCAVVLSVLLERFHAAHAKPDLTGGSAC